MFSFLTRIYDVDNNQSIYIKKSSSLTTAMADLKRHAVMFNYLGSECSRVDWLFKEGFSVPCHWYFVNGRRVNLFIDVKKL